MHTAASEIAEFGEPATIATAGAAHGLEQALTEAPIESFISGEIVDEGRRARQRHGAILRRFRAFIEAHQFEPLHIPEVCAAMCVGQRTLRAICQEQLGTNPKQYLLSRRMLLARKALRESNPEAASVTEIATRYGFWELGRFAVDYRLISPPVAENQPASIRRSSVAVSDLARARRARGSLIGNCGRPTG
jgi:AraC-like DNA-binding protein